MLIERSQPEDLAAIQSLFAHCGLAQAWNSGTESGDPLCIVMRTGRNIVGAACLYLQGNVAIAHALAVLPGFRGGGIGRSLVQGMEDLAAASGATEILLHAPQAEFFFRAMGYVRPGVGRVLLRKSLLREVRMAV